MRSIRSNIAQLPLIIKSKERIGNFSDKSIAFILPVQSPGGGANIVFAEARALADCGLQVAIINISHNKEKFEKNYPDDDSAIRRIYVDDPREIGEVVADFDVVIATAHESIEWIRDLSQSMICAYYVQDYEPLFYKDKKQINDARKSYQNLGDILVFTKTQWNKHILQEKEGVKSLCIGPSFDSQTIYPVKNFIDSSLLSDSRRIVISAMIRTSSFYRSPEKTMETLKALKEKYTYGIDVIIFGSSDAELVASGYPMDFQYVNMGVRSSESIRHILSASDLFIDLSTHQAMGLTAMEAMACGATVVAPQKGGAREYATEKNSLLVDTSLSVDEIVAKIGTLISDKKKLLLMQEHAIEDISHFHEFASAANMLEILFTKE